MTNYNLNYWLFEVDNLIGRILNYHDSTVLYITNMLVSNYCNKLYKHQDFVISCDFYYSDRNGMW